MSWSAIIRKEHDIHRVNDQLKLLIPVASQVVTIKKYKKKRSLAQNALMWMWFDRICKHVFETKGDIYSSQDVHDFFVEKFLPMRVIEFKNTVVEVQVGTSELSPFEMSEFLDKLDYWCAERMSLLLPKPEDLWEQSRG